MSTTINEARTVELLDGTSITVRPLKISLLRPFMTKFEGIAEVADNNEKSMTLLMECVQIALQQFAPDLAKDTKALEELLDLPTVYKIVEEASGIKLSEASLMGGLIG
jgi:hypothetical protein